METKEFIKEFPELYCISMSTVYCVHIYVVIYTNLQTAWQLNMNQHYEFDGSVQDCGISSAGDTAVLHWAIDCCGELNMFMIQNGFARI